MNRILFVTALVMLIAAAAAVAAPSDTVKIFLWDNDAGESAQKAPAAVMDRDYNSFYVWADNRDGNWNIYGRCWERKPAATTGAFLVSQSKIDENVQESPDVAGTTGDFYFVVWQDSLLASGEFWQIYCRKMDRAGHPITDQMRVLEVPNKGNAKFPRVAVNARTQDFVVVWQDNRDGDADVYARLFDYRCNPLSGDVRINEDLSGKNQLLPAASFTDKGIAFTWQDYQASSTRPNIYMRYFKPDLTPAGSGVMISENTEVAHIAPAIAASDSGFFTIAWVDYRNHVYGDIYAQRFDPGANKIDQNKKVNLSTTPVICGLPSVTMGIDNVSFWTSWADYSNSTDKFQIRARFFDKSGRFNTGVKVVNDNYANGQRAPEVCRFDKFFSVAWLDSSRTNGRGDIFGQYFVLDPKNEDTLDVIGVNYNITADKAAGRKIWYHPGKNYDNPGTPGWDEDPIAEPDSIYIPLDSAYVRALTERNIPNQNFFQITDTDTLEYTWRKQGKINSREYDMCLLDLGYAEDGSTAGVIQPEQIDSLVKFANDTSKCLMVAGNDFGEMYYTDTIFTFFGSKYVGPGNPTSAGNIQKIEGLPGTFAEGMFFDYPYQQASDNSVDIIDQMVPGSQVIMGSDPAKSKWSYCRATSYSSFYKGGKASNHNNVYLTFSIGSLSSGIYPSTQSELTRRILGFQGFNVEPEPIVDLVDSVQNTEGYVQLSWTAVSDDNAAESASKYWLKYSKYNASASDLGKMSSETDFIDTGSTYYQTWAPLAPKTLEKKTVGGLPPGDTLIFALKAGDESSPVRWGTLGNEPKIVVYGDTVTPHTVRLGYTYGCVNDFIKSERIGVRNNDTLFTTWDASNLYLGYTRCDWRTQGDLFIYFDTRTGGADSTCAYNTGDSCSGFDPAFRPDFCLIVENGTTAVLKKATGSKTWVDSIASYSTAYLSLDSINKYNYLEVQVPFAFLKYTVGNVFKYLVVCNNETNEHSWNAFPITNNIGKGAKAPLARYPYFYQFTSLSAGVSPRVIAQPLAVDFAGFSSQNDNDGITLTWQTYSETNNYAWLIERSTRPDAGYALIDRIEGGGNSPNGKLYSYTDKTVQPFITYYYRLGDQDMNTITWYGPVSATYLGKIAPKLDLMPCRPNPMQEETRIAYAVPNDGRVSLNVYDICGRRVKTIVDANMKGGRHYADWFGNDDQGNQVPAGVYFYRINFQGASLTRKLIRVK